MQRHVKVDLFRPFNYILCIIIFVLGTNHIFEFAGFWDFLHFYFQVIWSPPLRWICFHFQIEFFTHFHPNNNQVANDFHFEMLAINGQADYECYISFQCLIVFFRKFSFFVFFF